MAGDGGREAVGEAPSRRLAVGGRRLGAIAREYIKIVLLCVTAAVLYGIVHDQITARVCVEYFTIGHPPVFQTEDPTLLGLGWGVIATWWVGVLLGCPLAGIARAGPRPKRSAGSLIRPVACLMGVSAAGALLAGVVGWNLAASEMVQLEWPLDRVLPPDRHTAFIADACAHAASYLVGFFGGLVVMAFVWRWRVLASRAAAGNASAGSPAATG